MMNEDTPSSRKLRVFLCHSTVDKPAVRELYRRLQDDGFEPWLDEEDILPGIEWDPEIVKAIRDSDVVIVCLSRGSITKEGYVQKEIKDALDVADEKPEGTIFLIPLRLEDCNVPERLRRWQYANLYEEKGYDRLRKALQRRAHTLGITGEPSPAPLLAILSDQKANDLTTRIAAGNALGMLGDPRLDEMISIPSGTFKMGTDRGDDESPQREVYLDTFEIAKYPLTNVQYKTFLDANPDHSAPQYWNNRAFPLGKANHPVVNIPWDDAQAYVKWLSKETGKRYRLPTEAEWEKAARGDKDVRVYPWSDGFDPNKCNTSEGSPGGTTPVGIYPEGASPYGVMDMVGNVWEWCTDWYDSDYYKWGEHCNPTGPEDGHGRVVRGGSWLDHPGLARCSCRFRYLPDYDWDGVGVRVSRTP